MRTNIDIDDELLKKVMKAMKKSTKKAAVHQALEMALRTHSQAGIKALRGKVQWEGDLEQSRLSREF